MTDQPEALRLADALHLRPDCNVRSDAARVLREQHAEIERLRHALEIIAGYRQCVDPLMGNQDVARATLDAAMEEEHKP